MPRDRTRETRAYRWFHQLLRMIVGPIAIWYYRLGAENLAAARRVRPPYIVAPNHVMTWDPVLVSYFLREPVYWVAADANFRRSFFSWWLRRVGTIAKSKNMSDFGMMRQILKLLGSGRVIGIFAEGQRTWDGATLPLIPSTAKLIKLAGVPVVSPILKGAYLTLPRWALNSRRGRVIIEYRIALTAEEVKTFSVAEIHKRLVATLSHDDSEWQKTNPHRHVSSRSAETLQLALFWCPECDEFNTMKSQGHRFYCESCGYQVRFSSLGWFAPLNPGSPAPRFTTVHEWTVAQQEAVRRKIAALHPHAPHEVLFQDSGVEYLRGFRTARLSLEGTGSIAFARGGVEFRYDDGRLTTFPWDEIRGVNVVYRDQLEFYSRGRLCVFRFPRHDTSGLKYLICADELARQDALRP